MLFLEPRLRAEAWPTVSRLDWANETPSSGQDNVVWKVPILYQPRKKKKKLKYWNLCLRWKRNSSFCLEFLHGNYSIGPFYAVGVWGHSALHYLDLNNLRKEMLGNMGLVWEGACWWARPSKMDPALTSCSQANRCLWWSLSSNQRW